MQLIALGAIAPPVTIVYKVDTTHASGMEATTMLTNIPLSQLAANHNKHADALREDIEAYAAKVERNPLGAVRSNDMFIEMVAEREVHLTIAADALAHEAPNFPPEASKDAFFKVMRQRANMSVLMIARTTRPSEDAYRLEIARAWARITENLF